MSARGPAPSPGPLGGPPPHRGAALAILAPSMRTPTVDGSSVCPERSTLVSPVMRASRSVLVFVCAAALLGAPGAWASGSVVKWSNLAAGTPYKFGQAACSNGTAVGATWDFSAATNVYQSSYNVVARYTPNADCTANSTKDYVFSVTNGVTGSFPSITDASLLFTDTCASSTTSASSPGITYICAGYYVSGTTSGTLSEYGQAVAKYAMNPPDRPVNVGVSSGDGLLRVTWTDGNASQVAEIANYPIYVLLDPAYAPDGGLVDAGSDAGTPDAGTPDAGTSDAGADGGDDAGTSDAGADAGDDAGTSDAGADAGSSDPAGDALFAGAHAVVSPTTAGTVVVDHDSNGNALVNGRRYLLRLAAVDNFGNTSAQTASFAGQPTPIDDFYDWYKDSGGQAGGGGR
jgi:hypothetical protein